jgi:3-hydroxyisobutyrate dehydrogenase
MARICVLGAGLLGSGMVENLLAKGHAVAVWNRTAAKLAPLVALGAEAADSPAAAVAGAARVHLVLSEDDAVDATLAAAASALSPGQPLLDHSTNLPPRVVARFQRLRADGLNYLPAPVFMGPQNGREGSGLMLIAGPTSEVEALRPALMEMTGKLWHVGERPDLAAVHKLVGNAVLISLAATMGDVLALGQAQGLDPDAVMSLFEVFKPGHALPFIGKRVAQAGQGPASFELSMARKDVRLMIEAAGGPDGLVVLPATAQAMDAALDKGQAKEDFAIFAWPDRKG